MRGSHSYAKPGWYRVTVTVSDGSQSASATVGITVSAAATGGITAGFDTVCISDDGVSADCDGGNYSLSRQALAAAGVTQGESVTVAGTDLHVTLPAVAAGRPDNAEGDGQTVPVTLPADATKIAFVGTGTEGNQTANATLTFSDGSTQTVPMNFPDWTLGGGGVPVPTGYTAVAAMQYRLNAGAQDGAKPFLFAAPTIDLPAGKTLTGVVMPDQPGTRKDDGRVHLFGVASDGTPAPALALTVGGAAKATTGQAATIALGQAGGGEGSYTARVQWGDATVTEDASVDSSGAITGTHTWAAAGTYTVHVTVSDDQTSVTKTLTVTVASAASAKLTTARSIATGGSVSVTGSGFGAGQRVVVTLATSRTVTADAHGKIATSLPAPTTAGVYAVTATGSRGFPATATVAVRDAASAAASVPQVRSTLVLSSATAMPGERVSASGAGYRPNEKVTLTATARSGSHVVLGAARADGDGVFATTFVMPSVAGGLRSVTTSNAAVPGLAPAQSPLITVRTPHGTR